MGLEPDVYKDGDGQPCPKCWGSGKTFGDVPPPKTVHVLLSGIEPCEDFPDPPNGTYKLTQLGATPCVWRIIIPDWFFDGDLTIGWEAQHIFTPEKSVLYAGESFIDRLYFFNAVDGCVLEFTNEAEECNVPARIGFNGTGVIY